MEAKEVIKEYLDQNRKEFADCADLIHSLAEPSAEEYKSCDVLCALLENHGFAVEKGLKDQPTAFRAAYGTGKTRIGYMCEYDALATLQQDDVPYLQGNGGFGHGCGHNLLGAGSAAAGIALKEAIDQTGLDATVVVYGTPAEETLLGKTIMVSNGYFRDVDVCIGWHPLDHNDCGEVKFKAASSMTFTFHGVKAHACNCPENGRSALDAAELMSVGCNYLREHIDRDSYIHYSYINGGDRPNIVPDYAKVWYYARAYTYDQMLQVAERIKDVARGAALMTGTTVEWEVLGENHDNKLNFTLSNLAYECMNEVGIPTFTEEEKEYAATVAKAVGLPNVNGVLEEWVEKPDGTIKKDNGSSDISDVSQIVPTVNLNTVCYGRYTPNHSWAVTVQANKPAAHKGMIFAAKVLASMGERLVRDSELLDKVKVEFAKAENV